MNCDCYNRVNTSLKEKLEDPTGTIDAMLTIDDNKLTIRPCVTFLYHKKNQDGTRQKKQSSMSVAYGFCPFCGKAYEHDKVEEEAK